tara:strand:+ start:1093 stop:1509 length:417 start_codon:yes stop_codon:yes gene_type:complete
MPDYSNFSDIQIKYSSEFKELYQLALFCLRYDEKHYIEARPFDHTILKHLRDRYLELVVFPMLGYIDHPIAKKYMDSSIPVKPDFTTVDLAKIKSDLASWGTINNLSGSDFTTAFEAFKDELEAGDTYNVDESKAATS